MAMFSKHRVLIAGIISPLAALFLYTIVYTTLTHFSTDLEKDWLQRLSLSILAMTLPFFATLALAMIDSFRNGFSLSGKIGLAIAALSLFLVWSPVSDGIARAKQERNMALRGVPAPIFETTDLDGKMQSLANYKGNVVLINIWATWCGPCRAEMPKLDRLYQNRKQQGFIVFGLSGESIAQQHKFLQKVPVSYPLLTLSPGVPNIYRDIARYPAIFLVDRQGRLQHAPTPDQPFENVETAVDALLGSAPQ